MKCCIVYLDDVIVFARTWKICWEGTLAVIDLLNNAGFALSILKIKFLVDEVVVLGHKVVNGAYYPNPKKMSKLCEFNIPRLRKAL